MIHLLLDVLLMNSKVSFMPLFVEAANTIEIVKYKAADVHNDQFGKYCGFLAARIVTWSQVHKLSPTGASWGNRALIAA